MNRPLLSFVLLSYNQENYIREAVEGAFAQTYSPLEIIISDDASPDRTFDIIEEMAAAYTGPHKVIINRNTTNLGLGDHVNKVFELSSGEIIISAAGDDVSEPERASAIAATFSNSPTDTMIVYSNGWNTDEAGNRLSQIGEMFMAYYPYSLLMLAKTPQYIHGATMAWRRDLMSIYGPFLPTTKNEDIGLLYRAIMCGRIEYIDKLLVNWRRTTNSLAAYTSDILLERTRGYGWRKSIFEQFRTDLMNIHGGSKEAVDCLPVLDREIARCGFLLEQWRNPGSLFGAICAAMEFRSISIISEFFRSKAYVR